MQCGTCGAETGNELNACGPCLRDGLGSYPGATAGILPPHSLCKVDMIELCVRVGKAAGFRARTEVGPVPYRRRGVPTNGRIDVVWDCPELSWPFYSIEVEGRNTTKDSIRNDAGKFVSIETQRNMIALFQVGNDRRVPKGTTGSRQGYANRVRGELHRIDFPGADVYLDSELFQPGGAEGWATRILAEYRLWRTQSP